MIRIIVKVRILVHNIAYRRVVILQLDKKIAHNLPLGAIFGIGRGVGGGTLLRSTVDSEVVTHFENRVQFCRENHKGYNLSESMKI